MLDKKCSGLEKYVIKEKKDQKWLYDSCEEKYLRKIENYNKDIDFLCKMLNQNFYNGIRDPFVDVFNRRYLDIYFKSKHSKKDVFIAMIDINKLKEINDKEGHIVGDALIKDVADMLKEFGPVIRFGGDEFVVILKDQEIVDKFEKKCASQILFAYGIAQKTEDIPISEAIDNADAKMYLNKAFKAKQKKA